MTGNGTGTPMKALHCFLDHKCAGPDLTYDPPRCPHGEPECVVESAELEAEPVKHGRRCPCRECDEAMQEDAEDARNDR